MWGVIRVREQEILVSQNSLARRHAYYLPLALKAELITIIVPGKWNNLGRRLDLFHSIFLDLAGFS